jgi:hypothetical protein
MKVPPNSHKNKKQQNKKQQSKNKPNTFSFPTKISIKMKSAQVAVPLATADDERVYMPLLGRFKFCCLCLGLLVGFFIYLSTLGAEFVAVMLWGREILSKSNNELIMFSLGWNLITTMIALLVLTALRRLVIAVAYPAFSPNVNVDDVVSELLSYLEGRFAVGALVGICLCWNITNFILGMRPQIIQSCVILAVACMWCRMTLALLGQAHSGLIYDRVETEGAEEAPVEHEDDKTEPLLIHA